MLKFLKRKLENQKGAMNKVLVSLLLVVIGVSAITGFTLWVTTEANDIKNSAVTAIDNAGG